MIKKKILVIFGGNSPEYEISLQSAYSVIMNLNKDKYNLILLGITREGVWYRYYGDVKNILNGTWNYDKQLCVPSVISPSRDIHGIIEFYDGGAETTAVDAAFPVLHGKNGEDGTVQGLIELAGIPLVGCGTLASALCMDKDRAHKLAASAGIKVPVSVVISKDTDDQYIFSQTENLRCPLFVKPLKAGSSFGISKVYGKEHLTAALAAAFLYDDHAVIEENVEGFEVGCAVMGNDALTIGEVDEIELTQGFFDYTEKYSLSNSKIHMPARIDVKTSARIKETAALIYKTLGCTCFARVDMFLTPEGEIVFNEVNTVPGFTSHSRFPNMMKGAGLSFKSILDKLIELGMER